MLHSWILITTFFIPSGWSEYAMLNVTEDGKYYLQMSFEAQKAHAPIGLAPQNGCT